MDWRSGFPRRFFRHRCTLLVYVHPPFFLTALSNQPLCRVRFMVAMGQERNMQSKRRGFSRSTRRSREACEN